MTKKKEKETRECTLKRKIKKIRKIDNERNQLHGTACILFYPETFFVSNGVFFFFLLSSLFFSSSIPKTGDILREMEKIK